MGKGAPEDHSAEVARIEAQTAADARAQAAQAEKVKQAQFDKKINSAFGTGISDAERFFSSQGLDPRQYKGLITQKANNIRGGVPNLDANPNSYFSNLGQQIYDEEQTGERNRDLRGIDEYADSGFETRRIGDDVDDDYINEILGTQKGTADEYIQNLLDRGVVTAGGAAGARKNLEGQSAGAKSKLSELTRGVIDSGRSGAVDIAGKARTRASNQKLGDNFDPASVNTDLSKYFGDWFAGLGDKIRGIAPTDLFSTSGLANVAGASQGAGNLKFDPNALAGIDEEDDDVDNPLGTGTSPF